ncbi:hypothetical protein DIPPA_00010 [Diplonema papillatum]|nr:hypothetical protein DIPPA_00010 [Diplonema papillatum]
MYWSTAGEVSTAELAIDFEVFTVVYLPGHLIATSLKVSLLTRTKKMAKMLATLSSARVQRDGAHSGGLWIDLVV